MHRKIFFILLFAVSVYSQVYKTDLPTLVRGYQPFEDSLIVLILANAPGGVADTTHYVVISKVIFLQDSLNAKLNRSEYNPTGFDSTFVYQAIALKDDSIHFHPISKIFFLQDSLDGKLNRSEYSPSSFDSTFIYQRIDDSTMHSIDYPTAQIIRFLNRNLDSLDAISLAPQLEIGEGNILRLTYNFVDSNYVLTSETSGWDKSTIDDMLSADFDDSLYHYIAFSFGNDDSLVTGGQVTGYVTGLGYATWALINDSNYVKTSEVTNWDKTASDDRLIADTTLSGGNTATRYQMLTGLAGKAAVLGADDNYMTDAEKTKLTGIAAGAEVNVNADWSSGSGDSQILNKPTVPDDAELFHISNTSEFYNLPYNSNPDKYDVIVIEDSADATYNKKRTLLNDLPVSSDVSSSLNGKQATLISGTNIKTINSTSLLGSGDIAIPSLSDGDKGEITVASSGAVWTVDDEFPKGHIWGLVLSNNGADALNDIDIAVGQACDGDAKGDMILGSSLIKRMDAGWAVGTNQGGLNTGSEANSTWYEVHLIKRVDTGVIDVMFTTTANRATLPANYTLSRRIGWIYNNASGNIDAFTQRGNYFTWTTQVNDTSGTLSETAEQVTLRVPPFSIARFRATVVSTALVNEFAGVVFSEIVEGNVTPALATGIASLTVLDLAAAMSAHFELRVNSLRMIEMDADNTVATFDFSTFGWIDERCQYGDY